MGIIERKERERQKMRELILLTASTLFVEQGCNNVSMRNIAEAIEYSPATIYLYYKDKNELLYALSEEGFRKLFAYFQSLPLKGDPLQNLQELGKLYIQFALENPIFYDLMFIMRESMESHHTKEGWSLGMKSHDILTNLVHQCMDNGYFKKQNSSEVVFMIWSFIHGMVSFKIRNRMKMYKKQDHEKLIDDTLITFNKMLGSL